MRRYNFQQILGDESKLPFIFAYNYIILCFNQVLNIYIMAELLSVAPGKFGIKGPT